MAEMKLDDLDQLYSAADAAERLAASTDLAALNIQATNVRDWKRRGILTPTGLDTRGRPLYRLVDILRCEASVSKGGRGHG